MRLGVYCSYRGFFKCSNFLMWKCANSKISVPKVYFFKLIFNHKKPKVPETNDATKMAILE